MPTCTCNGAQLYFEEAGPDEASGPTIVCLHGAWCGLRYFQPQLDGLSDAFRVVALDFRGHGRSEVTAGGHTIRQYADDVAAFLADRGLRDVVLVGWSLGALVSWDYCDRYGTDLVAGLVNVDMEPAPGDWGGEHGRYDADRLREIHAAVQDDHLAITDAIQDDLVKHAPRGAERRWRVDEVSCCPPGVKSAIILDATTADYRDALPRIDVPSLVCIGTDEKWRSVAAVEASADRLPDATTEYFEDSGHIPQIEEPDRFNDAVRAFADAL